jgi:hypothetical protein
MPVQGCRHTSLGLETPERIETKIDAETKIDITLNEITLRHGYGIPGDDGVEIARFSGCERTWQASSNACARTSFERTMWSMNRRRRVTKPKITSKMG